MSQTELAPTPSADWKRLYAFGWPAGSVRALMALIVFGTIWALLVLRPEREVPEYLRDLLFIVLGHYFAVRSRASTVDENPGPPPLYLPRGSVRILLIAGFVGVAFLLRRHERLFQIEQNPGVVTLLLVFGFLLGVVLKQVGTWWAGRGQATPRIWEDLRALVSLSAAALLAVVVWDQFLPGSPHWGLHEIKLGLGRLGPAHLLSAIVGFYFGARS
ncbi:MAG: hypothetical protein P4L84_09030 [Isosphaeraceae bacterium]|nr:hypothetical protein [Isosphaeraceae bacterium]